MCSIRLMAKTGSVKLFVQRIHLMFVQIIRTKERREVYFLSDAAI